MTENSGKRTAGVDQEIWETPEKKRAAIRNLNNRAYHPLPLKRGYIPKSKGKMRALGIPTMRDRAMPALHLLALDPVAETLADPGCGESCKSGSPGDGVPAMALCYPTQSYFC